MKYRLLIVVLSSIIALAGCKLTKPEVLVCGKIDGYYEKTVWAYSASSVYINRPFGEALDSATTNNKGEFCMRLRSTTTSFLYFFAEDNHLLVETPTMANPRDSVFFHTSFFNASRPEFGGDNASFNQHFFSQRQAISRIFRYNRVNEWTINHYRLFVDSLQTISLKRIDSISIADRYNSIGTEIFEADLKLFLASKRLEYLKNTINETQGIWKYLIPNKDYYSFKHNILDEFANFWFLPSYSMAVDAMVEDELYNLLEKTDNKDDILSNILKAKLDIIQEKYVGVSKEVALAQQSKRFPEFLSSPHFFSEMERANHLMSEASSNPTLLEYFDANLSKVSSIKPGELAPNITLPNSDDEMFSTHSLRGKVVLLVFWGTWCPPCLTSIPKYIDIQKRFDANDVAFVFVSLEPRTYEVEEWKRFIKSEGTMANRFLQGQDFPGIHIVAQGQFSNPQVQPYAITYAPSYVLINKEGKIAYPRVNLGDDLAKKIEKLVSSE